MGEPKTFRGFWLPPNTIRGRVRQQRTVYSVAQLKELQSFFNNNHYPTYDERETLAARLNLQEQQVQVWFKNRRAKDKRKNEAQQQDSAAIASSQDPRGPSPAPAPGPAAAGPGFSGDDSGPEFSGNHAGPGFSGNHAGPGFSGYASGPGFSGYAMAPGGAAFMGGLGFYSPPPLNASSHMQAWGPTQDTENPVTAAAAAAAASAPATAPVWPEEPSTSGFGSETPTLADLLLSKNLLEGHSSLQPGQPENEESGNEDDSSPKKFLDL